MAGAVSKHMTHAIPTALLGGLLSRNFGFNTGVQFMGYYTAVMSVPALTKLVGG